MAKILAACSKNGMEKLRGDEWIQERNEWECEHGTFNKYAKPISLSHP